MHLKNLTLRGFKSFASATTLDFEPGITTRTSTGFLPRKGAGQLATALFSLEVIWEILSEAISAKFPLIFVTCVVAMRKQWEQKKL